jgi:small subunit ribosomal protein S21
VKVEVFDNQIEPALKALKKQMRSGGLFKEMKRPAFYETPSVRRKRKRAEARRKRLKVLRRARAEST